MRSFAIFFLVKYLGIDYGTKRVGLALSDTEGIIANPLTAISNDETLVRKIKEIVEEERVEEVVIGLSKNYKGEDNPLMDGIRRLRDVLEKSGMKVHLEPEYLTSQEARRHEGGMPDASAAALILQSHLDRIKK